MKKLLIAITLVILAIALSMGGAVSADSCAGMGETGNYDSEFEKNHEIDIDAPTLQRRTVTWRICGLPDHL